MPATNVVTVSSRPASLRALLWLLGAIFLLRVLLSATSGASPVVTNLRILLPLMRGAIFGAVALMFILLTHEFAASLLVRASTTQVMGTLLYDMWQNGSYPLVAAMALLMTAVTTTGVAIAMLVGGRNVLSKL